MDRRSVWLAAGVISLAAAGGGYLFSRLVLAGGIYWLMRTVPLDLGDVNLGVPAEDWRVALFLVLTAIAATAFFALVPALRATRIEPVRTLRGELVADARPGRAGSRRAGGETRARTGAGAGRRGIQPHQPRAGLECGVREPAVKSPQSPGGSEPGA